MRHYNECALAQYSFKDFDISIGRSTRAQLYCLDSFGEGESAKSAQENCDKYIVSEDCEEEKMVCGVGSFQTEDSFVFNRGCLTTEEYSENAAECAASTRGTCVVAILMCDTTNCSPDKLPSTGGN